MSVFATAVPALVMPLPDIELRRTNGGLIARWYGKCIIAGDASGGLVDMPIYLSNQASGVIGARCLFDIRGFYFAKDSATAVNVDIIVNTSDNFGADNFHQGFGFRIVNVTQYILSNYGFISEIARYKFSMAKTTAPSVISIRNTSNENGITNNCSVYGYLYDEMFITAD